MRRAAEQGNMPSLGQGTLSTEAAIPDTEDLVGEAFPVEMPERRRSRAAAPVTTLTTSDNGGERVSRNTPSRGGSVLHLKPHEDLSEHLDSRLSEKVVVDANTLPASREQYRRLAAVLHDGQARGIVSLMRPDPANGVIEIGGILHARSVQRTPVTTETAYLLLRHAFDDLGHRRVEWKCDSLNEPSRVAARRLGFTYEGRFRHHVVVKGRNRDTDWFAITDTDWPAIRAAHEAWLDPANFDVDGRQRTALRPGAP